MATIIPLGRGTKSQLRRGGGYFTDPNGDWLLNKLFYGQSQEAYFNYNIKTGECELFDRDTNIALEVTKDFLLAMIRLVKDKYESEQDSAT